MIRGIQHLASPLAGMRALALVGLMAALLCGCGHAPERAAEPQATPADGPTAQVPAPQPTPGAPAPASAPDPVWEAAKSEATERVIPLYIHHRAELAEGLEHYQIERGSTRRREIALTFDDGPHPSYTNKLVSILQSHNARATFFMVGSMAAKYPELVKLVVAGGNQLANHTYHHENLTAVSPEEIAVEMKACGDVLRQFTPTPPRLFRPPGGNFDKQVLQIARAAGYSTVFWTTNTADYLEPGVDTVVNRVVRNACNGAIFLMHDGYGQTILALPKILDALRAQGYRLVTVDELTRGS